MKIIFAGTPDFAASSLAAIIENNHQVVAVYTQPDRPAGRGKKLVKSPVKLLAEANDIPVYQPEKLTEKQAQEELSALNADLMIVAAYGLLLPKVVLDTPKLGCVNIHASLLPRWRGAAPIQRSIQAGDTHTGITIMQMDEGLDTGDMLLKLETEIASNETGGSLHDRLADLGADAILDYLNQTQQSPMEGEKQGDSDSNYARKLSKQEAEIDWTKSAEEIERTIRAFNPWPVAFTLTQGERVRIFEAQIVDNSSDAQPGTVIEKSRKGIIVKCGEDSLSLKHIQLPGAKAMAVEAFVNGGKALLEAGELLGTAN